MNKSEMIMQKNKRKGRISLGKIITFNEQKIVLTTESFSFRRFSSNLCNTQLNKSVMSNNH